MPELVEASFRRLALGMDQDLVDPGLREVNLVMDIGGKYSKIIYMMIHFL